MSRNPLLITGLSICIVLCVFMAFPGLLSDKSPYTTLPIRSRVENGTLDFETAPFKPSDSYVLGSDELGRDIWSSIVYGTRLTISLGLLVVIGRFIIAMPLALAAGFGSVFSRSVIRQFGVLFSAVPSLLISIILLKQPLILSLDKTGSLIAFIFVLSFVGWAKLGNLLLERTEGILRQPFIRGEIAIGKTRFRIALDNVIPHLAPEIVVLFFMEIARALSLVMQLGIFGVFVGNLRVVRSTDGGVLTFFNISFEPEWASMLGTARNMIYSAPWVVVYPALAFLISVLGFNLLGEGLRNQFQKPGSDFTPLLRRALGFNLKSFRSYWTWAVPAVLLVIILIPSWTETRKYTFKTPPVNAAFEYPVIIGSENSENTAEFIRTRMESIGIRPLDDKGYIYEYDVEPIRQLNSSRLILDGVSGQPGPVPGKDFSVVSLKSDFSSAPLFDARRTDLLAIRDYSRFEGKSVLIDKSLYSDESLDYIAGDLLEKSDTQALILIARPNEQPGSQVVIKTREPDTLIVSGTLADVLVSRPDQDVRISAVFSDLESRGRNIAGIFPGSDPALDNEVILIGMPYNCTNAEEQKVLAFNLELMKRLCTDFPNRRSYVFFFLDGTTDPVFNGLENMMGDYPFGSNHIDLFLDLTGVSSFEYSRLLFNAEQAPVTRYLAWSFGHLIKEYFEEERMEVSPLKAIDREGEYYFPDSAPANFMFWKEGVATIRIGTRLDSGTGGDSAFDLDRLGSVILKTVDMNNY